MTRLVERWRCWWSDDQAGAAMTRLVERWRGWWRDEQAGGAIERLVERWTGWWRDDHVGGAMTGWLVGLVERWRGWWGDNQAGAGLRSISSSTLRPELANVSNQCLCHYWVARGHDVKPMVHLLQEPCCCPGSDVRKRNLQVLKQPEPDLKCPRSRVSTEGGEATAAFWKWYGVMDVALGSKPSITQPVLISSASQETVVVSTPSVADPVIQDDWTPSRKRRREEGQVINYIEQMEKREERREAEQQTKDEQRYEEARRREEATRARDERREEEAKRREEEARARTREEKRRPGGERRTQGQGRSEERRRTEGERKNLGQEMRGGKNDFWHCWMH
ncbi:Reticulocyte-binding protein 2 a [Merluccius polli]|uniref:Reticulocyte-binding protein 2 a n=1 Tax=Merluccius polli TaxID=89951 RepID=A0AA47NY29_MERPO|nr:Reticulocyte-binding protein 2 a [Merluccius polli]